MKQDEILDMKVSKVFVWLCYKLDKYKLDNLKK